MKSWPFHAVFAIILGGSLAVRERASDVLTENGSLAPAVMNIARSNGLVFRQYATRADSDIPSMVFESSHCSKLVLITILNGTFDHNLALPSAPETNDLLRYVYIDRAWHRPDPLGFFFERLKYAAMATFGLTTASPSRYLLRIEFSPQCQVARTIDWHSAWDRN